jgi:hypothetical protein
MLYLAVAIAAGAIWWVTDAWANHYHVNCVGHGFVHGSSTTDNEFHSRVENGCGNPGAKRCDLDFIDGNGDPKGSVPAGVDATCNTPSNGQWGEYASVAIVDFNGVFSVHNHSAH